jgi:thiol-disulfide isomerase/thioredoxin
MLVLALVLMCAGAGAADAQSRRGWLGVSMQPGTAEGVKVNKVVSGSPAQKGGVLDGDRILRIDGTKVSSAEDVQRIVAGHVVGDVVNLLILRGGSENTLKISITPRPSADEQMRLEFVGKPAPLWTGVEPVKGSPKNISVLRGRVVVLDFWATWCGVCKYTAPILTRWQARYGAQGLSVIGITSDPREQAAVFAERHSMGFGIASDETSATHRIYNVSALPTLFVVDKRGVVREVMTGYDPTREADLEALVRRLLAEP